MSVAVTTTGGATRRLICQRHGGEYGQRYVPGVPGQRESYWDGACRECEVQIRRDEQAAEELEKQTEETIAEAERRIAADPEHEQKIQERAAADLAEEVQQEVDRFCALNRPKWEEYHRDLMWNEVVKQIEDGKRAEFLQTLNSGG